jgi:hypothetical protein
MRNLFLFFDLSETFGISLEGEIVYVDEFLSGSKTSSFLL